MSEILDNPIWHALTDAQEGMAVGRGAARRYRREVAPFSAIAEPSAAAYDDLAADIPAGLEARLFRPEDEPPPPGWLAVSARPIVQMVAVNLAPLRDEGSVGATSLSAEHAKAMLALAQAAKPGPFGPRAVELGGFIGFRWDGRLVAMGGERFRPPGYVELSAICVHPDARGAGLGARLTLLLGHAALARGEVPFLHVFPDNPARLLYERLGFRERRRLWVLWRRPA